MPKTTLADRLSAHVPKIRAAYRQGKRTWIEDGVKFNIRRCGPDNNYLAVSPVKGFAPVLNFPYDERKHDDRMEMKRAGPTTRKDHK